MWSGYRVGAVQASGRASEAGVANGEVGRLQDFLLSLVPQGVVGVDVSAVEPPEGAAAGDADAYRVGFERHGTQERWVFVISQPTYLRLTLGIGDREIAERGKCEGWVLTEPSHGAAERVSDQIFPSLRSAALFAAERAGVVFDL